MKTPPFAGVESAPTAAADSRRSSACSLRELTVVKRSGRKVLFDRDKLSKSISVALRKRPIEPERIDRLVSGLVRQLESSGETEITSAEIGELVMAALRELDPVAYVRFASVYRDFRDAADFHAVLRDLASDTRDPLALDDGFGPERDEAASQKKH